MRSLRYPHRSGAGYGDAPALTTGTGGVFDVTADGDLLYPKKEEGRHAEPGEVLTRFEDQYGEGVSKYGDE